MKHKFRAALCCADLGMTKAPPWAKKLDGKMIDFGRGNVGFCGILEVHRAWCE